MFITENNNETILIHAHNSFLEFIASNGIVISLLFFAFLFLIWKKKNILLIMAILFFCLFQYGIFWGYSILDVIFVAILLQSQNINLVDHKQKN
jgi:hypothetical protein